MIRNFLIVALRNFLRQKLYSLINIAGLAAGLICTLFIYLWVSDETNKDKFHRDSDTIFQIVSNIRLSNGESITWPITPGPLAEDIRDNIPEVMMAARTQNAGSILFQNGAKGFMETGIYADPEFFQLFSFPIVNGKPNTDTTNITAIAVSQALASKLFGTEDPIGKIVRVNNQTDYSIAAVFADIGGESSLHFDFVLPFQVYKTQRGAGFNWGNYDHPLYLKLHRKDQATETIRKINERRAALAALGVEDDVDFYIQPFTEHYLNSHYENGVPVGGRIGYVRIFSVVAVFILLIACINFMNMATARAVYRAKEVGVRKVIGAQRRSLIVQFISEATLISMLAMIVALSMVYLSLPIFNSLVEKQVSIHFTDPTFLGALLLIVVVTGLLAGSYPAFFLSSYQPAQVLKGGSSSPLSGSSLRRVLVIFQFALTVILIACSLVVYDQIQFIRNTDIGYNRQSVLSFSARAKVYNDFEAFKTEVLRFPGIISVGRANETLVQVNNQSSSFRWPGKSDDNQAFFRTVIVDYDFLETMGLRLVSGRFQKRENNDTSNVVITRRTQEIIGLSDPIGQDVSVWGKNGKIVGVVEDFHSRSLHESIDPVVFLCRPEWTNRVFVRFDGHHTAAVISNLEKIYKKYNPEYPFAYTFLEDDFEKLYNTEKVTGSLAIGFTFMAIVISGLGLLGLAAYTAERRKKEIGIRKTMGATVMTIVLMISKDFVTLSLIAAVIGCPIAYYLMQQFLQGYAYHANLGWELFVVTAISVLVISLVIVIFQVAKAAVANPVDALRNE